MRVSKQVVVMADATKVGRRSLSVIAKLESGLKIITDESASSELRAPLKALGIELVMV